MIIPYSQGGDLLRMTCKKTPETQLQFMKLTQIQNPNGFCHFFKHPLSPTRDWVSECDEHWTFLLHIDSWILLLFIFGISLLNRRLYPQRNLETAASVSMLLPLLTLKMSLLSCAEVLHHHNAATGVHKQTCNTTHRRTSAWTLSADAVGQLRSVSAGPCFICYMYMQ